MERVRAFAADTAPLERRGRHAEAPLAAALWLDRLLRQEYAGLPAKDREALRAAGVKTAAQYSVRGLSECLGYREPASWIKRLREGRRQGLQLPFQGDVKPRVRRKLIRMLAGKE